MIKCEAGEIVITMKKENPNSLLTHILAKVISGEDERFILSVKVQDRV